MNILFITCEIAKQIVVKPTIRLFVVFTAVLYIQMFVEISEVKLKGDAEITCKQTPGAYFDDVEWKRDGLWQACS